MSRVPVAAFAEIMKAMFDIAEVASLAGVRADPIDKSDLAARVGNYDVHYQVDHEHRRLSIAELVEA